MKLLNPLILFVPVLLTISCSDHTDNNGSKTEPDFYTQSNSNRVAAEWEPAIGTMIVWPLCIPHTLVIELAKDNHLYTLVADETSKEEAVQWYAKWGIDSTHNSFIYAPQGIDAWWVRDWGPPAVFTPEGQMKLADGKYIYSTPVSSQDCDGKLSFLYMTPDNRIITTDTEDNATVHVGKGLNTEVLDLPYISTGGNVLTDGLGSAFSTCIILDENRFYHIPNNKFLQLNKDLLGIERYHVIPNFLKSGIQHIDCFLKLLDPERILVAEPPANHELYPIYQNIVEHELKKLRTPYGRPYEILRIKTAPDRDNKLAAYTNSLIVNKTIYVPLFEISEDSAALQRWREVMPGYTVKGFTFNLADEPTMTEKMKNTYRLYGWKSEDALHCRTRAVWDPQMLFMTGKRIDAEVSTAHKNIMYCTIIDYSHKGLYTEKSQLFWRISGQSAWDSIHLNEMDISSHYHAEIPVHEPGKTIEYFIAASSKSGRTERLPGTAPLGFYRFVIK